MNHNRLLRTYFYFAILFAASIIIVSCSNAKYAYSFTTGKYLDFGKGKWIINKSDSNSKVYDTKLYTNALESFTKILGDSLYEIQTLRQTKLISPEIKFDLSKNELLKLGKDTNCDYLINISGKIVSNGAGSISLSSNNPNYSASNEAEVTIKIYNLQHGNLLSYSSVNGKIIDEGSQFGTGNHIPSFIASAETIMIGGTNRLIRKYNRYRTDK